MWGSGAINQSTTQFFDKVYFGQGAGSGAERNFTGDQVQVKWGGSATLNSGAASHIQASVTGSTLTVTSTFNGTTAVGQYLVGASVPSGTTIISNLGGGTWGLSASIGPIGSEVMDTCTVSVSDVFTLAQTFDNTKNYVLAYDTTAGTGGTIATAVLTNADLAFINTAAGTDAAQTTPSGSWDATNTNVLLAISKIDITSSGTDTFANEMSRLMM